MRIHNTMQAIATIVWISLTHWEVIRSSSIFSKLWIVMLQCHFQSPIVFHQGIVDVTASRLPEIPVTTSLMPYTRTAIPITKAASAMPNSGDAITIIDKAIANAPAAMLNALEPVLAVLPFSLFFPPPLKPAIMLEMPLNSRLIAASNTTNAAEARGYAIIMLERIMTNIPRPM
jgi:hypothetical protein